jgi:hypothetical protein
MTQSLNQALIGVGMAASNDRPRLGKMQFSQLRSEVRLLRMQNKELQIERDILIKILSHAAKS